MEIIIKGIDQPTLDKIIEALRGSGATARESGLPEVYVWTLDAAEALLRDLGHRQRDLLIRVARAGGRLDADVMRGPQGGSLKGLTGPITVGIYRLARTGVIPDAGIVSPVLTKYDPEIRAYQRAVAFTMHRAFIPAFLAAADRLEAAAA